MWWKCDYYVKQYRRWFYFQRNVLRFVTFFLSYRSEPNTLIVREYIFLSIRPGISLYPLGFTADFISSNLTFFSFFFSFKQDVRSIKSNMIVLFVRLHAVLPADDINHKGITLSNSLYEYILCIANVYIFVLFVRNLLRKPRVKEYSIIKLTRFTLYLFV